MNQSSIIGNYTRATRESLAKAMYRHLAHDHDGTTEALFEAIDMLSQGLDRLAELVVDP